MISWSASHSGAAVRRLVCALLADGDICFWRENKTGLANVCCVPTDGHIGRILYTYRRLAIVSTTAIACMELRAINLHGRLNHTLGS